MSLSRRQTCFYCSSRAFSFNCTDESKPGNKTAPIWRSRPTVAQTHTHTNPRQWTHLQIMLTAWAVSAANNPSSYGAHPYNATHHHTQHVFVIFARHVAQTSDYKVSRTPLAMAEIRLTYAGRDSVQTQLSAQPDSSVFGRLRYVGETDGIISHDYFVGRLFFHFAFEVHTQVAKR